MSLRSHIKELQNFLGFTSRHCRGDGEDDRWETVQRKGNTFVVNDQPFYVNGFNTYWLMILAVDPSTRGKVGEVLRQASSVGLTVCRTWAFNDGGWRALQKSPGVYDEQVFKALDFVVSEARKNTIRLILSLCNNWEGYGGKAQYVRWGKEAGLNLTSDDDFFSDPTVKGYYKAHVQAVLNRVNTVTNISYREDPTIFAWELMNEPSCPSDPSGDKLQSWIQEMAAHVKSIDPLHLLGIGSEGFYGPSSPDRQRLQNPNDFAGEAGTDFLRNHKALGIDFASAHLYPDSWLPKTTTSEGRLQFSRAWMQSHIEDAERLAMPVIFGEFGFSAMEEGQFNQSFRNAFIDLVYGTILNSTRHGGAAGGSLLWQLFPEGVDFMDDGYAVVLGDLPATASLLSRHSRRLQIFNSRCSWNCRWTCRKRDEDDEGRSILRAPSSVESPQCRTSRNEEE